MENFEHLIVENSKKLDLIINVLSLHPDFKELFHSVNNIEEIKEIENRVKMHNDFLRGKIYLFLKKYIINVVGQIRAGVQALPLEGEYRNDLWQLCRLGGVENDSIFLVNEMIKKYNKDPDYLPHHILEEIEDKFDGQLLILKDELKKN